jgi:hypothetical protein
VEAETRMKMMTKKTKITENVDKTSTEVTVGKSELAQAIVAAIEAAKPVVKKNPFNRVKNTPWTPKDGSPRAKLKRKMYHHGVPLTTRITNEEIELLNKLRPGTFCDGYVRVVRRRDKGINIDYKVKTASDRLKLVNQFGIRNFKELLERLVDESSNPIKFKSEDELD